MLRGSMIGSRTPIPPDDFRCFGSNFDRDCRGLANLNSYRLLPALYQLEHGTCGVGLALGRAAHPFHSREMHAHEDRRHGSKAASPDKILAPFGAADAP